MLAILMTRRSSMAALGSPFHITNHKLLAPKNPRARHCMKDSVRTVVALVHKNIVPFTTRCCTLVPPLLPRAPAKSALVSTGIVVIVPQTRGFVQVNDTRTRTNRLITYRRRRRHTPLIWVNWAMDMRICRYRVSTKGTNIFSLPRFRTRHGGPRTRCFNICSI